ncbi:MAG: ABC transporter substrate-binding protein [Gammaproteobacteria bacterium]|nr:ABC transporter substrate-binding protein [Gammaproteobacteria bacterium]
MQKLTLMLSALLALAGVLRGADAQTVRIGVQTGIGYLPLQVMVEQRLLEKHAAQKGLQDVRAELVSFANGNAMNDALLAGAVQYASGGVSTFLALWNKAEGASDVRGAGALLAMPMYLNTRNPAVKSIRDFTEKDRIGVAGIKVSYQAMLIQMAAAKEFGPANSHRLDPLTVTVSNPNGVLALSNPTSDINTHFTPPPFAYWELRTPGVHTVLKSYDILGGAATLNQAWTTVRFRNEQRALHDAFWAALQEATRAINDDKRRAAETYLKHSGDKKSTVAEILQLLQDPEIQYSVVPNRVMVVAEFLTRVGSLKRKASSWRDFYFEEVQALPGS